ncbi:MAG TPA: sterol desaturase family protein, partial [Polyangiaceae bacterium]|nr:sterol desaturase family protein [Polyangiaceae bacterium]
MRDELLSLLDVAGQTLLKLVPITIVLGAVFAVLTQWSACNPGRPWWRKREIVTDLLYWFLIPVCARFARIGLMVVGAALLFDIHGADALIAFYDNGFGPLAAMPLWGQIVAFLVASDLALYWLHRLYHGAVLWKYHAVHHSSAEVEWISAARFHPVNILFGTVLVDAALLLAGISPNVMLWVGPFTTAHSAFVHANLNWTLGPFRYVLAGPVFHRWHHTAADRGGSKNFAGTFPVFDLVFGTYHMPKGELPDAYGIGDRNFPGGFGAQLL